jgi:hypothetical protein
VDLFQSGRILGITVLLNINDQVKEDEMGRACNTNGGEDKCIEDIGGKARRKETTRKNKG